MNTRFLAVVVTTCAFLLACFSSLFAEELKPIQLSPPQMDKGRPLMQVLKDRQTNREFSPDKLSVEVLSNLLWAATGINRPDSGKRTSPTAQKQTGNRYLRFNRGRNLPVRSERKHFEAYCIR